MTISSSKEIVGLKGTTLIIPGPGNIGYLGNLSIDLLINTLSFKRLAQLSCPYLPQIIGTRVYDEDDNQIYTTFELFQSDLIPSVTLLQLRSAPVSGYGVAFSKSLAEWIKESGFQETIVLTGLDKSRRSDEQLITSPLRYACTDRISQELKDKVTVAGLKELEPIKEPHGLFKTRLSPGSGSTQFLFNELEEEPVLVISFFTQSGGTLND